MMEIDLWEILYRFFVVFLGREYLLIDCSMSIRYFNPTLHIKYIQFNISMQALEKYLPFKTTGLDFADSNPIFAYFFFDYFLINATNICVSVEDPDERNQVETQIKEVNGLIAKMQGKSMIKIQQAQNLVDMLQYTELMFAKNEHQFANNFKTKQMAEDYLTIHRLYEVIKHFHGLNEQQNKRRVFAKKRFIELMKELKNKPQQESKIPPPPPPKPIEEKIKASVFKAPLPKPTKIISFDKIQMQIEANKRLENAMSELSFDRFKFAKEEVLAALELLEQLAE